LGVQVEPGGPRHAGRGGGGAGGGGEPAGARPRGHPPHAAAALLSGVSSRAPAAPTPRPTVRPPHFLSSYSLFRSSPLAPSVASLEPTRIMRTRPAGSISTSCGMELTPYSL